jgi:hypothetical protein
MLGNLVSVLVEPEVESAPDLHVPPHFHDFVLVQIMDRRRDRL